ncbi:MAG: hypothetical protein LUO89_11105 [Methanothrix sp.]|nr:hypothetical protein [Methanothrix sp.]
MVDGTNDDSPVRITSHLALKMAFEAEIDVPLLQQLGVHRSMYTMAGAAPFPNGFMFENEWTPLCDVALHAEVPFVQQGGATGAESIPFVGLVAIDAGHFAF